MHRNIRPGKKRRTPINAEKKKAGIRRRSSLYAGPFMRSDVRCDGVWRFGHYQV